MANARLEVMPKGGHFAAWEQPELLSHEIIQFFGLSSGFGRPETFSGAQEMIVLYTHSLQLQNIRYRTSP